MNDLLLKKWIELQRLNAIQQGQQAQLARQIEAIRILLMQRSMQGYWQIIWEKKQVQHFLKNRKKRFKKNRLRKRMRERMAHRLDRVQNQQGNLNQAPALLPLWEHMQMQSLKFPPKLFASPPLHKKC